MINGKDLIKGFEGLRLDSYQDVGGVWTIGYGHVIPGKWKEITKHKAEALFDHDYSIAEQVVFEATSDISVSENMISALTSFVFNLGEKNFEESTLLLRLKARDYFGAANEFIKWIYCGNVQIEGLKNRRIAERNLFCTPDNQDVMPVDFSVYVDQVEEALEYLVSALKELKKIV